MDTIPSFQKLSHLDLEESGKADEGEITEEIDKFFEGPDLYSEEFSVKHLLRPSHSAVWKPGFVDESDVQPREFGDAIRVRKHDLNEHRRDSFPLVHAPLKPSYHFHHRHKGRRRGHHPSESEDDHEEHEAYLKAVESAARKEKIHEAKPTTSRQDGKGISIVVTNYDSDDEPIETSPLLSPDIARLRSCIRPYETEESEEEFFMDGARKKGRVQFNIGSDVCDSEHEQQSKLQRRKKSRKRQEGYEDPEWRRYLGSEKPKNEKLFTFTTTEDEAKQLKEHELDQISSHRFEDKGIRKRFRTKAKSSLSSFIHPSEKSVKALKSSDRQLPIMKKAFDHNPHEIFVELSELVHLPMGGMEWKETARWIKYEEDVEGVDNRWGKPHIAMLNFNALFCLRKGLERGAVLLDLEERDLPGIATRVVDHMVACDQIPPDQRDAVIKILLLRHKHIKEHLNAFRRASRGSRIHLGISEEKLSTSISASSLDGRFSVGRKSLSNIFHVNSFTRNTSTADELSLQNGVKPTSRQNSYTQIDVENEIESREKSVKNLELLKKIPEGAEATAVLVGAVDFLKQPTIAFVRLAEGVVMENVIEVPIPVRFLFVLLGPFHGEMDYHEVGRSISTLMSDKSFHEVAYRAHSRGQLLSAINEFLNASIVFPPSDWNNSDLVPIDDIRAKSQEIIRKNESIRAKKLMAQMKPAVKDVGDAADGGGDGGGGKRDPLKRTGKLFHGLIQDVKIRYSQYLSDITDGLSPQVISAAIFIFFAALSPAITFGGMYGDQTDKYIGVGETLLVSSISGVIFSLFAAQPLLIVGATGPLMIFDLSLLSFCKGYDLDFLSLRVWVGIWVVVIGLLVTAFEAVSIVKMFTRFTEEIFSTLICIIFIYGAFEKLFIIFKNHPLVSPMSSCFVDENNTRIDPDQLFDPDRSDNMSGLLINGTLYNSTNILGAEVDESDVKMNQPNTALLSMCLMFGTFLIAWKLKKFRNSKFLGRSVRRALGDFGVPIAIFLMVLLDYCMEDTYTDKLTMPKGLQPSNSAVRGWLINPFGVVTPLPVWCMLAAAPASLLLFILIFIEENICHLILSKPERCLKKGTGFHMDILLSCLINTISGFLGAPFMGPACVRTIAHMSALTVMSSNVAPGESPKIVGCIEQRLSSLVVSALVGLAVLLYAIMNLVPTAVLLGIFLYMGISSTAGIQLLERTVLYLMPVKHHYNVPYVKKVRTWKMHCFTGIQILMLVVLWIVRQSPAALCVPFVLMCLIPIRLYLLPFMFTSTELIALDGHEQPTQEELADEPDFYDAVHNLPTQIEENELEEETKQPQS